MSLTLFSPAKINLFLRIIGKRTDGYHELASLFQAIDLGDTLAFELAQEDHLTCSDPRLPCDGSNLIIKALHLFRKKTGLTFGINIHIEKNIPIQAGLGGGSSNAATTLWALNTLHNKPYSEKELQFLSAELGSDVPFFFSCGTAFCTGKGEKVENLSPIALPMPLTLFKPAEGIATPAVYQALNLKNCSDEDPQKLLKAFYTNEPLFINDLEEPACRLIPALEHYKHALLKQGWSVVSLSGSGTTFFGFEESGPEGVRDSSSFKDFEMYLPSSPNSALKSRDCGLGYVQKAGESRLFKKVHLLNRIPQSWY